MLKWWILLRIPFDRAIELAQAYNVSQLLTPLFEYTAPPPASSLVPDGSPSALNTGRYFEASVKNAEGQQTSTVLAREQGRPDLAGSDRKRVRDEVGLDGAKRVKLETNGVNGATANEGNKLIHSTKPLGAHDASIVDDPLRNDRHKAMLKSVFSLDPDGTSPAEVIPSLSTIFPPDLDPDTAIDDNDHTALHWAAALARVAIVHALVDFGADMQRGNHVGETPLIRAVLVTNNSDQDSFPALLEILGPSVRTFDDSNRTVLHHAALVAGVKGRASSARYYMECILEYIARHEKGQFRELVDAQDENGDTALNIAARVGNRALVRILIDVGADKMKPNKLGLRPGDFGVETAVCPSLFSISNPPDTDSGIQELGVSPAEDAIASLRTVPSTAPVLELTEAISSITTIINSLNTQFSSEIAAKTAVLDQTRAQLREATRELAEQRKQITIWREKVGDVEDKAQRIRNLERALEEEDSFDWTGRTEIDGSPANPAAGAGFTYRGLASTLSNLPAGITIEFEADPPAPSNDTDENSLVHLMRLRTWYSRVIGLLKQRIQRLEGGSADQERKLQKIVAGCCGVEPDRIEGMLDGLLAALERFVICSMCLS